MIPLTGLVINSHCPICLQDLAIQIPTASLSYLQSIEDTEDKDTIRSYYETALSGVRSTNLHQYITISLHYAEYEEKHGGNNLAAKCHELYQNCLRVAPHKMLSVVYLKYARFIMSEGDITGVRCILDKAIQKCPTEEMYEEYLKFELRQGELKKYRSVCEQLLVFNPTKASLWIKVGRDFE